MPLPNRLASFGSFGNLFDLASTSLNNAVATASTSVRHHPRSGGRRPNKADQPSLDDDSDNDEGAVVAVASSASADNDDGDNDVHANSTTTGGVANNVPPNPYANKSWMKPLPNSNEARLTVVQITDVYTLDNFASLKTMLQTMRSTRQGNPNDKVVSMLTGDFLSPYLLSSIDRGQGMMDALSQTPIDYVIWGNHEADIDHRTVCKHVASYPGTWINTNMQSHDAMDYQVPYEIIEIASGDGGNARKIGLVAVLSDDPKLYSHFKAPGAFGGATIDDPWDTLRKYQRLLEDEHGCDVVLPLQHLYVPDDHRTCREFNFPVVLSGHDHHRVDEIVDGTRLIKPGMDGVYATVLEMIWDSPNAIGNKPRIRSTFVKTSTFDPCPVLKEQTDKAYDVLLPLRNTELMTVPSQFEPLSSVNARGSVTTMGQFVCTLIKDSLNQHTQQSFNGESSDGVEQQRGTIDAVILMGGNIRGGESYDIGSFFSLEMLEAEIKSDEVIGIVPIPGAVLAAGIECTHAGDPIPGWMQYDIGIQEEIQSDGKSTRVTTVANQPLDPNRVYRVATKISDLGNGQSPPFKEYFSSRPDLLPSKGSYFNIQTELMGYFARVLFRKLWDAIGQRIQPKLDKVASNPSLLLMSSEEKDEPRVEETLKKVESGLRLDVLDTSGDGAVSVDEIHSALSAFLNLSVHDDNTTLAKYVHAHADVTGNGVVTREDLEHFCNVRPTTTTSAALGLYSDDGGEEEVVHSTSVWTGGSYRNGDADDDEDGELMF